MATPEAVIEDQPVPLIKSRYQGWKYNLQAASVVLGGVLVHLTLGTIYTFGEYFTEQIEYSYM